MDLFKIPDVDESFLTEHIEAGLQNNFDTRQFRNKFHLEISEYIVVDASCCQLVSRFLLNLNVIFILFVTDLSFACLWANRNLCFITRTSSVAGLALCLVAITRATVVVLCRGENGTAVLSVEL